MFHEYHLAMQETENYSEYQSRRLSRLKGFAVGGGFNAVLDVIESQARYHKDMAFSANGKDVEEHILKAQALDEVYRVLMNQVTSLPRAAEKEDAKKSRVGLDRAASLRVRDKMRTSVKASKPQTP